MKASSEDLKGHMVILLMLAVSSFVRLRASPDRDDPARSRRLAESTYPLLRIDGTCAPTESTLYPHE